LPWGDSVRADQPSPEGVACPSHDPHELAGPYAPTRFSPQIPRFERPFEPLLVRSGQSVATDLDAYKITMQPGSVEIVPGKSTRVWTYDGTMPGPGIRQQKGRGSVVRFVNQLQDAAGIGVSTSIHLHGMGFVARIRRLCRGSDPI
jgi:hypothetical protein